ncbi:uncharacterized protein LOC144024297 isoform X2 [Festucalex cinctus]
MPSPGNERAHNQRRCWYLTMRLEDDDATFSDLLDLSFGGPRVGALDLGYLHRLLLALLNRLGIRDVSAAERTRGSELLERVRACEDGLEQALRLAQDLQEQMSAIKLRAEELHLRQQGLASASWLDELKDAGARLRTRVDTLEAAKADGEQIDLLRRLIGDTDRREACRHLDERVRLHEDAIERLTKQCCQLDDLQGALDRMMPSLTSEPSHRRGRSPNDLGGKLSLLLERKLADGVRRQVEEDAKLTGGQASILKLQSECDKLQEAIRRLSDDNKHKHIHILQLLRTTEELQENKVDKRSLPAEVKKQLDEAQQKNFQWSREKLRSPVDSQQDAGDVTAAGIRKQLLETHHCLSCDRHVIRHLHAHATEFVPSRLTSDFLGS